MILTYKQCLKKFKTDYQIKRLLESKKLFKISKGYYSDNKHYLEYELLFLKYPNSVFTLNSAFYYHGLTDTIPNKYYLATDRDHAKIKDKNIKQVFIDKKTMNHGIQKIKYNGQEIIIYSKERMLVELLKNKSKLPYDYYKEIVNNYRKIVYSLDIRKIEEYINYSSRKNSISQKLSSEIL